VSRCCGRSTQPACRSRAPRIPPDARPLARSTLASSTRVTTPVGASPLLRAGGPAGSPPLIAALPPTPPAPRPGACHSSASGRFHE
jgi:hypothetical protein